jgi:hypothetical protein
VLSGGNTGSNGVTSSESFDGSRTFHSLSTAKGIGMKRGGMNQDTAASYRTQR